MGLISKAKKLYRIVREQGLGSALKIARANLRAGEGKPEEPMSVQEWLSYYEKRSEIPTNPGARTDGGTSPKVSILILTYNNLLINQLCLRSIYCNTTYPNFEVVVVDNASADGSPVWLKTFAQTHPNLKLVLNTENLGFAGGNNQAARLATGEYLIFLNNDTVVPDGWVERLLAHMRSDPKVGMVGPVTNSTGNEARILISYHSPEQMQVFAATRARNLLGRAFDIRMLAFFCVMARADQYAALGGLDERFKVGMFEDDDLAVRYQQQGFRILCAEDVFIHHFQGASFNKLKSKEYQDIFEENRKKYEEKWGRPWEPYQSRKYD
jgi:GT2 family glycosyltransferase